MADLNAPIDAPAVFSNHFHCIATDTTCRITFGEAFGDTKYHTGVIMVRSDAEQLIALLRKVLDDNARKAMVIPLTKPNQFQ